MTDDITAVLKRSFNETFEIFDDVQQRFLEFANLCAKNGRWQITALELYLRTYQVPDWRCSLNVHE